MPYASVSDLPPAFQNLPAGAKTIALKVMNAVLTGKTETPELMTTALQAARHSIKAKFRRAAGGVWVVKSGTGYSFGDFHFLAP